MLCKDLVSFVHELYGEQYIPLHRPIFDQSEKDILSHVIDSNFVSSVGKEVDQFENEIALFTGSRYAISTVNGTAALHLALVANNIGEGDLVITQAVSFVATVNAISYTGAEPVFLDVDSETLGLSPIAFKNWLLEYTETINGVRVSKLNGKRVAACIPMHTFGTPTKIHEILEICNENNVILIEDAAEALGSFTNGKHVGTFGSCSALSFNGNKIITTGGGGMIITNDPDLAVRLKHLSTTAKVPHSYEYFHDSVAFNYRLPNLNAALGIAQMGKLSDILQAKKNVHNAYVEFFREKSPRLFDIEIDDISPNYWLNALIVKNKDERDRLLEYTNQHGVMTRPIWHLLSDLPQFHDCQTDGLECSRDLYERVVNLPSSAP